MKPKTSQRWGCALGAYIVTALLAQVVFLTLKLAGSVNWSWWIVLLPTLSPAALTIVGFIIALIIMLPREVVKSQKLRKELDKEAEIYGLKRQVGESNGDLKQRIVRRNMIAGNYSRKDIKDAVLSTFETVASCQMEIDNQANTVSVKVRRVGSGEWQSVSFSAEELQEILDFITQYVPVAYKVTIAEAKEEE